MGGSIALPLTHGEKMIDNEELKQIVIQQVKEELGLIAQTKPVDGNLVALEVIDAIKNAAKDIFDSVHPVKVKQLIDNSVESMIDTAIQELSVDAKWLEKIETAITQAYQRKFDSKLSLVDVSTLIGQHIDIGIDRFKAKLIEDFNTNGISDYANVNQLTIKDNQVIVRHNLTTTDFDATDASVSGTLSINNLIVKGSINTDNRSWDEITIRAADKVLVQLTEDWQKQLVDQIITQVKDTGISFDDVLVNGQKIIDGNTLSSNITETSIEQTGQLRELTVNGLTNLNNTVTVKHGRVGVNTNEPEMALSIWDEEIAIIAGKFAKQKAYIGTARANELSLGVNRQEHLTIDVNGLITIKQLRIGQQKIGYAKDVPGYSGTRGDLLFNSDPKPNSPFAWVCLGGYNWQTLKSA